jgi:hypothetical protein
MAIAIWPPELLPLIPPPLDVFSFDEQPTTITINAQNKNDRHIASSFLN